MSGCLCIITVSSMNHSHCGRCTRTTCTVRTRPLTLITAHTSTPRSYWPIDLQLLFLLADSTDNLALLSRASRSLYDDQSHSCHAAKASNEEAGPLLFASLVPTATHAINQLSTEVFHVLMILHLDVISRASIVLL